MTEKHPPGRTGDEAADKSSGDAGPVPAHPRSPEEIAREIGAAPAGTQPAVDDDVLRAGGRFKLDKSGALAGRPKLRPVKALRPDEPSSEDAPSEEASAGGPPGEDARAARPGPDKPRKAVLPPKLGALRPEGFAPPAEVEREEIEIPAGIFLYGDQKQRRDLPAFAIDRDPVTNADYQTFVESTGHRPPLYAVGGRYPDELADHPVVGVDYYDALAYAQWRGKDLPFEDEWERAARGTDGRTYPWGNDQELSGANTARIGLKMTVPVDLHTTNVSPDGVRDMVGNTWEITHSPAPGGGIVVRGGSWYDFALYAKTFFRFASRPDARNGTIGFRCVRRHEERPDVAREVDVERAEAEIAARRGEQAPVDPATWSAEKRDLVPDLPRLRIHVAEARAEVLLGAQPEAPPEPRPSISFPPPPPKAPQGGSGVRPAPEAEVPSIEAPAVEEAGPVEDAVPPVSEAEEPLHVRDTRVKQPGPAVSAGPRSAHPADPRTAMDREGWARQTERAASAVRAESAHRAAGRMPGTRAMPRWMWVLLALGFLLFGGLLVSLVNHGEAPAPPPPPPVTEPVPAPRSRIADLPEPVRYEEFAGANTPPRILDAAYATDRKRLGDGLWLLVFLDPTTVAGQETLDAAHQLHRRIAPSGVRVTIVLPRAPYARSDGRLLEDDKLDATLKADGESHLWDGIHVVLDPAAPSPADEDGASPRGVLQKRYGSAAARVSAVLLRDGVIESRTTPPDGALRLDNLVPVALRALELAAGR